MDTATPATSDLLASKKAVSNVDARKKARAKKAKTTHREVKTKELLASLQQLSDRGMISKKEFETKKAEIIQTKEKAKALQVFKSYDADGSGTIDVGELQKLVYELGEVMSKKEITDLLVSMKGGQPEEGKKLEVTFDEFFTWWSGRATSQATGQTPQTEKSRLLSLKLGSQAYKKKIEKQLKGKQKQTGTGEGEMKISIGINIGEIVSVTESLRISTSTGQAADDLRRTVGCADSNIPCAIALIKLLPTVLPLDEQKMLVLLNRCVGIGNSYISSEVRQAAAASVSSHHEGDDKYLKFEGIAPVAKSIDYSLAEPFLDSVKDFSFQLDLDSHNHGARGSLKVTIDCSALEACARTVLKERQFEEYAEAIEAAKNLEEFECELNTSNWLPILDTIIDEENKRTILKETAKTMGLDALSSSSSSSSSTSESDEDKDKEVQYPHYGSNVGGQWFKGDIYRDEFYGKKGGGKKKSTKRKRGSDSDDEKDVDDALEVFDKKLQKTWPFRVLRGALDWDEALFETANLWSKKIFMHFLDPPSLSSDEKKSLALFGAKKIPLYHGLAPFANLLEPSSVSVAFGKLLVKADFNFPNLLHRLKNPYHERIRHCQVKKYENILSEAYRTGRGSDFQVKVGSKVFNLHKPLVLIRCPQILDKLPADLDQAAFELIVKYIYSDQLPESFEKLLEALDVTKEIKFASMIDAVHRELYTSTHQANVYPRLLSAVHEKADDYIVNWLIYYAVRWEVPYSGAAPTKLQKKAIKRGKLVSWAVTQEQLEEAGLHARIQEQKEHLTLPRPNVPVPKADLGSALGQLRGGLHADKKILVNLQWFPVHSFILGTNWPQFQKIVANNEFLNLTTQQFNAFLDYHYLGDFDYFDYVGTRDVEKLTNCVSVLVEERWLDKFFTTALHFEVNSMISKFKGMLSKKQKAFETIGYFTGNQEFLMTLLAVNGGFEVEEKNSIVLKLNAESEKAARRANHILYLATTQGKG